MSTYWEYEGKHQVLQSLLADLVPAKGPCDDATGKNAKLERFRRASNCYYDLYNNGLCNREKEFVEIFHFNPCTEFGSPEEKAESRRIERAMNRIILAAAKEQGVTP